MVNTNSMTVLIVEDDPASMMLTTDILEASGFKCIQAINGHSAIHIAKNSAIDLILMDIRLPDINGDQVFQKLESEQLLKETTVIAVTASLMKGGKEKIVAMGFHGCIEKPINIDTFVEEIQKIIDQVKLQKQEL